jgi:hypothetical protein
VNPVNDMHVAIIRYFTAEKRESLLFMLVGMAAVAAAVFLWRTGSPWRGMGYPLAAIALIQLVVGGTVYFRTDAQTLALHKQLAVEPRAYVAAETPRMEKVQKSFALYRWIEIALLAVGVLGFFLLRDRQTLWAASIGLMLQSALMLGMDFVAERRAEVYCEQIRRLADVLG